MFITAADIGKFLSESLIKLVDLTKEIIIKCKSMYRRVSRRRHHTGDTGDAEEDEDDDDPFGMPSEQIQVSHGSTQCVNQKILASFQKKVKTKFTISKFSEIVVPDNYVRVGCVRILFNGSGYVPNVGGQLVVHTRVSLWL
jgi:hypothetical protein